MDRESRRHLDEFRREAGLIENTLIDELVDGELEPSGFHPPGNSVRPVRVRNRDGPRRHWVRLPSRSPARRPRRPAARLRCAITPPPAHGLDPHTYQEQGALDVGGIAGEFLTRAAPDFH